MKVLILLFAHLAQLRHDSPLVPIIDDVIKMLETGGDLIAAGVVELGQLGLDVPALLSVELASLERGHAVAGEVLEAGAPHVVVGVVVPGGRGLQVGPGHHGVVHHGHPALGLEQALGALSQGPFEGQEMTGHSVVSHRVGFRLKSGRRHRFVDVFLEIFQVGFQFTEIWGGHHLTDFLSKLWMLEHHGREHIHQLRMAQALHANLRVHAAHSLAVQLDFLRQGRNF